MLHLWVLSAIFCLFSQPAALALTPTPLLGYWKLNDSSSPGQSSIRDSGPFALHATPQGKAQIVRCSSQCSPTAGTTSAHAAAFNGAGDFLAVSDFSANGFSELSAQARESFTVGAWVQIDMDPISGKAKAGIHPILSKIPFIGEESPAECGFESKPEWQFLVSGDRVILETFQSSGSVHSQTAFDLKAAPGGWGDSVGTCYQSGKNSPCWHFVAIAWDQKTKQAKHFSLRPAGENPSQPTHKQVSVYSTQAPLRTSGEPSPPSASVLRMGYSPSGYFFGKLKGVFLSKGVLSDEELLRMAQQEWPCTAMNTQSCKAVSAF